MQNPPYRDVSSRQLTPYRQGGRVAQQPNRDREDQQARQNRLAGLPREREAVAVDQLPQRVRDMMTRGAENGRTPTGRHRQAERNHLARQYRASDATNLDNRLAHLQVRTGTAPQDLPATARSERSALAAKVLAAREQMRAERSGPASSRDMSRDGRTRTRNGRGPRDSRGPGNRADGRNRDRGDRTRNAPSLGRG
ncbi:MAG TPA: hypothetical protein VF053_16085 [Streptosporangiales bacterium]